MEEETGAPLADVQLFCVRRGERLEKPHVQRMGRSDEMGGFTVEGLVAGTDDVVLQVK